MDTLIPDIHTQTEHHTLVTLKEINDSEAKNLVPVTVFYVIVMVLGLLANTLVIIIHKVRPTGIYIVCLAVLDITACIVGIPYHVLDLMNPYTYFYPIACKLLTFLMTLPLSASMFMLVIVAIDRYLKLCKPLRNQQINLESIRACVTAILCSLLVTWPHILMYGKSTIRTGVGNIKGSQCFFDDSYSNTPFPIVYTGFTLLIFVIVTLVLIVLYIMIWRAVIKQERYYNKLVKSADANTRRYYLKSTFLTLSFCMRLREKHHVAIESDDEKACASQLKPVVELDVIGNNICHSCQKLSIYSPERVPREDIKSHEKNNVCKEKRCMSKENTHCLSVIEVKGYTKKANLIQSRSRKRTRSESDNANYNSVTQHSHQHRTKLTKIMFTITFVFIMTYLPSFCVSLLNATIDTFWDDMSSSKRILYDVFLRLYLLNNMAKPFIYVVWESRFRRKCIRLFKRFICRSASSRDDGM